MIRQSCKSLVSKQQSLAGPLLEESRRVHCPHMVRMLRPRRVDEAHFVLPPFLLLLNPAGRRTGGCCPVRLPAQKRSGHCRGISSKTGVIFDSGTYRDQKDHARVRSYRPFVFWTCRRLKVCIMSRAFETHLVCIHIPRKIGCRVRSSFQSLGTYLSHLLLPRGW